ncbi:hypothetical protein Bbelb_095240 [Branchiostoma belcheri]|nr:hypothetical protein Bbelb_095240 [Branchiostoma belcheri]
MFPSPTRVSHMPASPPFTACRRGMFYHQPAAAVPPWSAIAARISARGATQTPRGPIHTVSEERTSYDTNHCGSLHLHVASTKLREAAGKRNRPNREITCSAASRSLIEASHGSLRSRGDSHQSRLRTTRHLSPGACRLSAASKACRHQRLASNRLQSWR